MKTNDSADDAPRTQAKQGAFLVRYWRDFDDGEYRYLVKAVSEEGQELFEDLPAMLTRLEALLGAFKPTDVT